MTSINLSERQVDLLKAVVEVAKADIDFTKVAELANMKTSKYARDQWAIVRTKLIGSTTKAETDIDTNGGSEDVSAETTTPNGKAKKKATPRKRKSDAGKEETPAKKKGKTDKAESTTPPEVEADEEIAVKSEPNEAGEAMDGLF